MNASFNLSDRYGQVYPSGNADSIGPSSDKSSVLFEYGDTRRSAATGFVSPDLGYKAVCIGFPLETVTEGRNEIYDSILKFFGL